MKKILNLLTSYFGACPICECDPCDCYDQQNKVSFIMFVNDDLCYGLLRHNKS